jgi:outer membrane protein OmpA-like peptidoglycan-associated protein
MSESPLSNRLEDQGDAGGRRGSSRVPVFALLGALILLLAGAVFVGYRIQQRLDLVERHMEALSTRSENAWNASRQAMDRAVVAETAAHAAAVRRTEAEVERSRALETADAALTDAESARDEAARARAAEAEARAEAERIRLKAEAELNRLEGALGKIAETRRTALGLVMNLGSDHLKFEFDKAELRPEDKELLSRIAGILLTSEDYAISVNGHTDDVGTVEYNQKLSERRAQAVRDYLVEAGLSPEILTVTGHGKSLPLVQGTSEEARAKNRRVELGIVNTRIVYHGQELATRQ